MIQKLKLLVLVGTLTLFGCDRNQGVAQPPQQATTAPQNTISQTTPLNYNLESYKSQVLGANRIYGVSLPPTTNKILKHVIQ